MTSAPASLQSRLERVEALRDGATTPGEREAAAQAAERIRLRMAETGIEPTAALVPVATATVSYSELDALLDRMAAERAQRARPAAPTPAPAVSPAPTAPPAGPPLTAEQSAAAATILARVAAGEPESILVGPAGTGKTTLLRSLIASLHATGRQVVACTPTGKAALRLQQVTGHPAATIHRTIYGHPENDEHNPQACAQCGESPTHPAHRAFGPDEPADHDWVAPIPGLRVIRQNLQFGEPRPPCEPGGVVIVDEGSMVGRELWADLRGALPHGASIIVVADREQLEPVNDAWGPDLLHPHAALTEIHRQAAGNPIIGYATATRQGAGSTWRAEWLARPAGARPPGLTFHSAELHHAAAWGIDRYAAGEDVTVLTWTHAVREQLNSAIRAGLGLTGRIAVGDRLVIRMNSYAQGLLNGEVHEVTAVETGKIRGLVCHSVHLRGRAEPVRILDRHLNDRTHDVWQTRKQFGKLWDSERVVHAWHGFALTIHSAQGSQWSRVGLVVDYPIVRLAAERPDEARRMVYTGITRAADALDVFWTVPEEGANSGKPASEPVRPVAVRTVAAPAVRPLAARPRPAAPTTRVLVTGGRSFDDAECVAALLDRALAALPTGERLVVVQGACGVSAGEGFDEPSAATGQPFVAARLTGADGLAHRWALWRAAEGAPVQPEAHPASWRRPDGSTDRAAGPARNVRMVDSLGPGPGLVLSFPGGRGTAHCSTLAALRGHWVGVPVRPSPGAAWEPQWWRSGESRLRGPLVDSRRNVTPPKPKPPRVDPLELSVADTIQRRAGAAR